MRSIGKMGEASSLRKKEHEDYQKLTSQEQFEIQIPLFKYLFGGALGFEAVMFAIKSLFDFSRPFIEQNIHYMRLFVWICLVQYTRKQFKTRLSEKVSKIPNFSSRKKTPTLRDYWKDSWQKIRLDFRIMIVVLTILFLIIVGLMIASALIGK